MLVHRTARLAGPTVAHHARVSHPDRTLARLEPRAPREPVDAHGAVGIIASWAVVVGVRAGQRIVVGSRDLS